VEECRALAADAEAGTELVVDLERQEITRRDYPPIHFTTDPFRRTCLLNGFDDIATTMQNISVIAAFEQRRSEMWPWLDGIGYAGKKIKVKSSSASAMEW